MGRSREFVLSHLLHKRLFLHYTCISVRIHTYTHIYIYIYIYMCVCVWCVCVWVYTHSISQTASLQGVSQSVSQSGSRHSVIGSTVHSLVLSFTCIVNVCIYIYTHTYLCVLAGVCLCESVRVCLRAQYKLFSMQTLALVYADQSAFMYVRMYERMYECNVTERMECN